MLEKNNESEVKRTEPEKVVVVDKKKKKIIFSFKTKIILIILAILIIPTMFALGVKFSYIFKTQEKTTKLGLRNVGELVTQTCYATVVEDSKVNRDFFKLFVFPFTESRQIFSYDFEVDASVKFDEIDFLKVDHTNKTIDVQVPHAKVYKTTMKLDSMKIFLDDESLFSRIDLSTHNEAKIKMQDQAQSDCVANGLLTAADKNASQLISGMIKGNEEYKDYTINIVYIDEENKDNNGNSN